MSQNDDFLKLLETTEPASEGGGGIGGFCQVDVSYGYKVFTSGPHKDSWFPVDISSEESKLAGKTAAQVHASSVGAKTPTFGVSLRYKRETVKGKVVTWKDDLYKDIFRGRKMKLDNGEESTFLDAMWIPLASTAGCTRPGSYWVRYAFVKELALRKDKDAYEYAWIPDIVYPNEAACEAAAIAHYAGRGAGAGSANHAAGGETVPAGYTAADWQAAKPYLVESIKENKPLPIIAKDYRIDIDFLQTFAATVTA